MEFDVLVVGGGIVGVTHATYLAERGLKTCLVERNVLASGTSARNFSWVNASTKTADTAYHHLNARGVDMYGGLAKQFGAVEIGLNPTGAIELMRKSATTILETGQQTLARLSSLGYAASWLEIEELRRLEPHIDFPDDSMGLLTPDDKTLNAPHFVEFMAKRLKALGGQIIEHCAAHELLADDNGKVLGLRTSHGDMKAPRVVLATGPNTPETLSELTGFDGFAKFPINKVPGLLVTTPPLAKDLLRHLIFTDLNGEFHFFPDFNGGLRIASDDVDGRIIADQSPEHLRHLAGELLTRMQSFLPEFVGNKCLDDCNLSVGIRAYPEDGLSIAGAVPGADGLFLIATHSGITLAPVLGSLMADLVTTGERPAELAPFGLDRLPGFDG